MVTPRQQWQFIRFNLSASELGVRFVDATPLQQRRILEVMEQWIANNRSGQPELAAEWVDPALVVVDEVDYPLDHALDARHMSREIRLPREGDSDLSFRGVLLVENSGTKSSAILGRSLRHARLALYRTDAGKYVLNVTYEPGADRMFGSKSTILSLHSSPAELFETFTKLPDWLYPRGTWRRAASIDPDLKPFGSIGA